ncbi:MAG: hypothetical protein ACXAE3_12110 [Candidatus Kariarchaeaceae archaeon]|jgi:hypothetical protein
MADELKKVMRSTPNSTITPEMKERIEKLKSKFAELIPGLATTYENEIPFSAIKEETNHPYQVISEVILSLILEKRITGFINDGGTEELDDDILIIRNSRLVDEMEPKYETGFAE